LTVLDVQNCISYIITPFSIIRVFYFWIISILTNIIELFILIVDFNIEINVFNRWRRFFIICIKKSISYQLKNPWEIKLISIDDNKISNNCPFEQRRRFLHEK
jgi:hypothetical protein